MRNKAKILKKMEINNLSLFFVGMIMIILGTLIVMFDYPQIQYLENVTTESRLILEETDKDLYQRLKIEFGVGSVILLAGITLSCIGIFRKSKF